MSSVDFLVDTINELVAGALVLAPFWLTVGLSYVLLKVWVYYARAKYLKKQEYVLLEVKLPQEILKTPLAMELVLSGLHQKTGETTWYDRIILGKVRPYFSLELASFEGQVKFFIRTRTFTRNIVEAQVYAQYPNVELHEVPDYTSYVLYDRDESHVDWSMWGCEFELSKEDVYPIKTYVDYGLDKSVREETEKIDPITPMLEFLGSLGKGEQAWFQILIRMNKGKEDKTTHWKRDLRKEAESAVEIIMEKYRGEKDDDGSVEPSTPMTPFDKKAIEAINKRQSKHIFDCGMRGIYLAHSDKFKAENIPALVGVVKQYSSPDLNGFLPKNTTDTKYPWQDYKDILTSKKKLRLFTGYRRRSWFFAPHERKPFILNVEELATIFHFPGGVAQTPTFGRIDSKKAEPPINLPV